MLRPCALLVYIKFETWWDNLWNHKNSTLLWMIWYSELYQREKGLSKLSRFCFFHASLLCSLTSFCQSCPDLFHSHFFAVMSYLGFDKNPNFSLIRSGLCEGRATGIGFYSLAFVAFCLAQFFCTAGFFPWKISVEKNIFWDTKNWYFNWKSIDGIMSEKINVCLDIVGRNPLFRL